eukprot:364653-Chlamydomonas_euryale.AAC.2
MGVNAAVAEWARPVRDACDNAQVATSGAHAPTPTPTPRAMRRSKQPSTMQASTSPARKRPRPGFYGDGDACCELQPLKASQRASTAFSDLPTEVLVCHVLNSLGSADLCTLMAVSSRLRDVQTVRKSSERLAPRGLSNMARSGKRGSRVGARVKRTLLPDRYTTLLRLPPPGADVYARPRAASVSVPAGPGVARRQCVAASGAPARRERRDGLEERQPPRPAGAGRGGGVVPLQPRDVRAISTDRFLRRRRAAAAATRSSSCTLRPDMPDRGIPRHNPCRRRPHSFRDAHACGGGVAERARPTTPPFAAPRPTDRAVASS